MKASNEKPARVHAPSISERISESSIVVRNWLVPGAREMFPNEPKLRNVDEYFPYAVGGALLVDRPMTEAEEKDCARKAILIKKAGFRYVFIKRDAQEHDIRAELGTP